MNAVGDWGGGVITQIHRGHFPSNAYAVALGGGACVLVDPGLDGPGIDADLRAAGLRPTHVVCTHGHFDHVGSASFFQDTYGAPVYLHTKDQKTLDRQNFLLLAFKIPHKIQRPRVTWVDDGAALDLGGATFTFQPAPGHTPGSCVVSVGDAMFTGDTLYARGVGLSKLPGEDPDVLRATIRGLWPDLRAGRLVCPGHGPVADAAALRADNHALLAFLGEPPVTP